MKMKFIPVNNDVDKAIAFANTLDNNFIINNQRIKQKPFYIPTLDVINQLKGEGWIIKGVSEHRDKKTRKITNNYVQLLNPNFPMNFKYGGTNEALVSLTLSNSTDGNGSLEVNLGTFREVCSNGAIGKVSVGESRIKHDECGTYNLQKLLSNMNKNCSILLNSFNELKEKEMNQDTMKLFAKKAAKLRFIDNNDINIDEILKVHRVEDEGNDMWSVFNRVQENLSYNIKNVNEDIRFNQQLMELVMS